MNSATNITSGNTYYQKPTFLCCPRLIHVPRLNFRLDYSYLKLTFNAPELDGLSSIEVASGGGDLDGAMTLSLSDNRVDWGALFDGLRFKNVYSEDDYIPGAT